MPSFDIVSEVDIQKLDNAINAARKELATRYDFSNSKTTVELDKKEKSIFILTENDMRMSAIEGIIISRLIKQGLEATCLDFGKEHYASGNMIRKDVKIKEGIDRETAKKLTKIIKDSGLKVQPAVMDEQLRVTGKKIDDLQKVMGLVRQSNLELPLQFSNFRN
jgi:cyclic-di-GMP-binding protein